MEEKAQLDRPTILSPKEGDKVEKLVMEGVGEPLAFIELNFSFWAEYVWNPMTEVKQDGTWSFTPEGAGLEIPMQAWVRVGNDGIGQKKHPNQVKKYVTKNCSNHPE